MNKINTYTNNIVIHLFEGEKITKTAHISATEIQKHQGKVISFLLDKYQPTAFEMRLEKARLRIIRVIISGKLAFATLRVYRKSFVKENLIR